AIVCILFSLIRHLMTSLFNPITLYDALPILVELKKGCWKGLALNLQHWKQRPDYFSWSPSTKANLPDSGRGSGQYRSARGLSSRSEEHTSELQSREKIVCRLLLEKKNDYKYR